MRRLLPVSAVVFLALCGAAWAMTPLVRTLDQARGHGTVSVAARTGSLSTEMWIARIGGTGVAHATGGVSCVTRTSAGTLGDDEAFSFKLKPSSRSILWRHAPRSGDCAVSVSVRVQGTSLLRVALRGY